MLLGRLTRLQVSYTRRFSTSVDQVSKGLSLIEEGQPLQAFEVLRHVVDNEIGDNFPRSSEVFHALGMLCANGAQALTNQSPDGDIKNTILFENDDNDVSGGAKNSEEVLAQIKQLRKNAMRKKHSKNSKHKIDEKPHTLLELLLEEHQPKESSHAEVNGIKLTKVSTNSRNTSNYNDFDKYIPTLVEKVVDEKDQLSASFYQLAADQGNSDSMVALANLAIGVSEHAYGIIVSNEDVQRGEKSEETGDVSKALLIDVKTIEAYEFIRKHSLELGLAWYERAAPHKDALFNMGQMFYNGRGGCERDPLKGISYFKQAAQEGDPAANYFLAHLFRWGDEDLKICSDSELSLEYLNTAIDKGHGGATYYKALMHYNGDESIGGEFSKPNVPEFLKLVVVAAEDMGDADALFCLADLCFNGSDGMQMDHDRAFKYWLEAAFKDHADAMCSLGACFYNGLCGQEVDYEKAFYWYQKAADASNLQGPDLHRLSSNDDGEQLVKTYSDNDSSDSAHIEAWSNIASMYALGQGVPKCMDTARHILRFLESIQK